MGKNYSKTMPARFLLRSTKSGNRGLFLKTLLFLFISNIALSQSASRSESKSPWASKGLTNEIESKRSRTAKHFQVDATHTTAFISASSIHFLNTANKWEEISTDIVSNTSVSHPYAAEKNAIKTYFPANPFADEVVMNAKEATFNEMVKAIKFLDASRNIISVLPLSGNVSASVNGNKIAYTGFHPDLSLNYTLSNDARKFDLSILSANFINSIPAGAKYIVIEESLSSTANLGTGMLKDMITIKAAGVEVLGFSKPVAFDSNLMNDQGVDGTMHISKNNGIITLNTEFPLAWITNPQRSFPIHLDPTANYYPPNVAYATGRHTSSTAYASGYLRMAGSATDSWAKFDISTLPAGAFVQTANYWGYHYTTLGVVTTDILSLTSDPVTTAAAALWTAIQGGALYTNNYQFAGTAYQWNMGSLGGTAATDIANAISQGWFAVGFKWIGGSTTFCYQYGYNAATSTDRPYLEVTYFTTPCSTLAPASAMSNYTNVCAGVNVNLSLSTSYTTAGIQYQWQSSSTGITGLFSNVTGTAATNQTGTMSATMAYRAVITCTNGPTSVTSTPILVNVGAPDITSAVAAIPLVCPGGGSTLSLANNYAGLGVAYQWQTATLNIVGPYTNVPLGANSAMSGTAALFVVPGLTATNNYFQAILSCTAAPSLSTITLPTAINVAGSTTNTAPYFEGFENVFVPNYMPNCSWAATTPTGICQTYTAANTLNRIPNNGSKFGSFKSGGNTNGEYFYTNGIQLEPGITYSASVWYTTDGNIGWTEFSMLLGAGQSPSGLTALASHTGNIAHTNYRSISNTFTVATSGLYNLAFFAKGSGANYLSFDDISITIPCSINAPQLTIAGNTLVCSGQGGVYTAAGADTYTWITGVNTPTANIPLSGNATIKVMGTNLASGCTATAALNVNVGQSPPVSIAILSNGSNTYVCKGSAITMVATGAGKNGIYSWSTGTNVAQISVSPTVATTYTVVGTNSEGCSSSVVQAISIKNPPVISVLTSAAQICAGESATLTATGANTYTWMSNVNYLKGTQVSITPNTSITYTVIGSDASKCESNALVTVSVSDCVGLKEVSNGVNSARLYPNPNNGQFTLEMSGENAKTIEVIDMLGKVVLSVKTADQKLDINGSNLSAGVYYVKIQSGKSINALKFVKH